MSSKVKSSDPFHAPSPAIGQQRRQSDTPSATQNSQRILRTAQTLSRRHLPPVAFVPEAENSSATPSGTTPSGVGGAAMQAVSFARNVQQKVGAAARSGSGAPSTPGVDGGHAGSRILQQGEGYAQPAMAFALPFAHGHGQVRPQPSQLLTEQRSASPSTRSSTPPEHGVGSQTPDPRTIAERVYDLMRHEVRIGRQRGMGV